MSIEGAREGLQSARRDLVQGGECAEQGREAADDVFSRFADAEGHRSRLLDQATGLRLLMQRAGETLKGFSVEVYKAATLQEGLDEASRAASSSFTRAEEYGVSARARLTEVLGPEDAAEYSSCIDFSKQAAVHALNTATHADAAEQQLFEIANKLQSLAQGLGQVTSEVMTATAKISFAGTSQDDVTALIAKEKTAPFAALRGQIANEPAAALENGSAATEAFGGAIQAIDERIDRF